MSSKDSWGRVRVEGYGYIDLLCKKSRSEKIEITTWKPKGSIRANLHSFFVGGSAELHDIKYPRIPSRFEVFRVSIHLQGKVLNKYGFVGETSGTVNLRTNTLVIGCN